MGTKKTKKYWVNILVFEKNTLLYAIEHVLTGKKAKKLIDLVKSDAKENGLTAKITVYELKKVKLSEVK